MFRTCILEYLVALRDYSSTENEGENGFLYSYYCVTILHKLYCFHTKIFLITHQWLILRLYTSHYYTHVFSHYVLRSKEITLIYSGSSGFDSEWIIRYNILRSVTIVLLLSLVKNMSSLHVSMIQLYTLYIYLYKHGAHVCSCPSEISTRSSLLTDVISVIG